MSDFVQGSSAVILPTAKVDAGFFLMQPNGNNGTTALTDGQLVLSPVFAMPGQNIDQSTITVTAAGAAGSLVRLGFYSNDFGRGLAPKSLLLDAGTQPTDTIGNKTYTTPLSGLPSIFWVGVVQQGGVAATTIRDWINPLYTIASEFLTTTAQRSAYNVNGVSGALPATLTAPFNSTSFFAAAVAMRGA